MFYIGNKVKMIKSSVGAVKSKSAFVGKTGIVSARIKNGSEIMFGISISGIKTGYIWHQSELKFVDFK